MKTEIRLRVSCRVLGNHIYFSLALHFGGGRRKGGMSPRLVSHLKSLVNMKSDSGEEILVYIVKGERENYDCSRS